MNRRCAERVQGELGNRLSFYVVWLLNVGGWGGIIFLTWDKGKTIEGTVKWIH